MDLAKISDEALLGKVDALAETERFSLIDLLLHLGELDVRTACQDRGYSSVFAYLTRRLGYSESDAIRRVRTARAARRYPSILRLLANGDLHLVSVAMLEPLLTSENHERLLRQASRRSTREVERLVAELAPVMAEPRDRIRPLPASPSSHPEPLLAAGSVVDGRPSGEALPAGEPPGPSPCLELALPVESTLGAGPVSHGAQGELPRSQNSGALPTVPAGSAAVTAQAHGRVVFTFAAGEQVQGWFEEARDLLRHRFPMGRMEEVIGESLRRLVEDERPAKLSQRRAPAKPSSSRRRRSAPAKRVRAAPEGRHIPKWVRDEVWRRDSGRCAYTGPDGLRCGETAWLEWDHVVPWARGGPSNDPANIRLLCRAHNQSEARRLFGRSRCQGRKAGLQASLPGSAAPRPGIDGPCPGC